MSSVPIWSMWARFQGLTACICLTVGGAIQTIYPIQWLAYASMGAGVIVGLLEFPVPFLASLWWLGATNFYFRGILYLAFAAPMFIDAPTTTGGLTVAVTGLTYIFAAIRGETWMHPRDWDKKPERKKAPEIEHSEKVGRLNDSYDDVPRSLPRTLQRSPTFNPGDNVVPGSRAQSGYSVVYANRNDDEYMNFGPPADGYSVYESETLRTLPPLRMSPARL